MAERDLTTAFDDCLDRLNNGESLQACLDAYPQFATALRPLLQTGFAIKQASPNPLEVQTAQDRGRARVLQALQQPTLVRRNRWQPIQRLVAAAALLVLIMSSFLGGATLAAESSLPGDPLYGLKRLTENVRVLADAQLAPQFGQRRLDEIRQLQALQRSESVDFIGQVTAIDGPNWQVAGLALSVPTGTPGAAPVTLNARVAVVAQTTASGELVAQRMTIIEPGDLPLPSPTMVPTLAPSTTATPTNTPSPTQTATITPPPLPTATVTPMPTVLPATSGCEPSPPADWISYAIRSGDTLSTLAAQTGITLAQLMTVNCLDDPGLIVIGQRLFLPFAPIVEPSQDGQSGSSGSSSNSGRSGSNSGPGNADDDDDDNSGPSENSGPGNADDDDDGSHSSGSSGSGSGSDDDHDDRDEDDS